MTDVIVLGAGIVGITTALALQKCGREVVVVDNGQPAHSSSFGNAGIIQVEAAEPYAMPRSMGELMAIARRHSNAVNWHWEALPRHLVPLWKYFRHSRPARHREIAKVYSKLTVRAAEDHSPLIEAAEAWPLIRKDGFRHAYRKEAEFSEAVARAERLAQVYQVRFTPLDSADMARAEPNLKTTIVGAIHWRDAWTCRDPGALLRAYTDLFVARGGAILSGDAMTLERRAGMWSVAVEAGKDRVEAGEAVICLGFTSALLSRRFGLRVPLFCKRGYHCHFATASGPDLLFIDAQNSAVLAPMAAGLRLLTGAEIALGPSAPTPVQLERATRAARELFDIGEPLDDTPWVGNRPCMPDMLPVVGALPGQTGLWANFGHGHQGFTLGPTTAALLSEAMTGQGAGLAELSPARRF